MSEEKIGFLSVKDLEDPELFARKLPEILSRGKCPAHRHKEPWSWRAHAYRVGKNPIGLFVWLMTHPTECGSMITDQDERDAEKATRRPRHPGIDREGESWAEFGKLMQELKL